MRKSHTQRVLQAAIVSTLLVAIFTSSLPVNAQDSDPATNPQPSPATMDMLFMPTLQDDGATPAQSTPHTDNAIIPGEYIVVLKAASNGDEIRSSAAAAEQMAATYGGQILYVYDAALNGFAISVAPEAAAAIAADPAVDYVEPNRVISVDTTQIGATWGLDRIDQRNLPLNTVYSYGPTGAQLANNNAIFTESANKTYLPYLSFRGPTVNVYIIDTGMRSTHVEFTGRASAGYTAINDGNGTNDCNGHGTHVAGTVGGTTYGVAKKVLLHPVRVLGCNGSGSTAGVIAGINWVTNNKVKPAVANMSLGGSASSSLDAAVNNSINAGITYVVAAGNDTINACFVSPARVPNAITVGSTTSADARSGFSNYGSCLDIFAPGSGIVSAWYTSNTAINMINGTSMASPHVAGAAALYLALNPNATPSAVRTALVNNSTPNKVTNAGTGSPNRLLYTGFMGGAPGACTNLLANWNFDAGPTSWSQSSSNGFNLICTNSSCGSTLDPRSAYYMAWLGGAPNETSEIKQTVTLPTGKSARLVYFYYIGSNNSCGRDQAVARVIVNGVTHDLRTYSLCNTNNTYAWVSAQFDLSAYAGKSVTVVLRTKNTGPSPANSNFFVDDVRLISGACTQASDLDNLVEPAPLDDLDGGSAENNATLDAAARPR